ncbi:MAG: cupin domain-containing protein [Phycisphaeraceae bacterium]
MPAENLFDNLPRALPEELAEVLVQQPDLRLERIVSTGQASLPGFWYDQPEAEWVVLLRGEAKLQIQGDDQPIHMRPGDYLNIPPHQKHRVAWTTDREPTVWLALFYPLDPT